MGDKQTYVNGQPCWADLGTSDLEAARTFYGQLFGWTYDVGSEEVGNYSMAKLPGGDVAGLGPQMNPGPPYWTTYFCADDADATANAVKDNGGQVIVPPMDVMTVGRMAVFQDPAGAVFSIWQPMDHKGADVMNEPGSACWFELMTRDAEQAKTFYSAVFGWDPKTSEMPGGAGSYTEFMPKGTDRHLIGMMQMGEGFPLEVPPHWAIYFAVSDTDAIVEKTKQLGGQLFHGPDDIPNVGRFAVLADPQGAPFQVIRFG